MWCRKCCWMGLGWLTPWTWAERKTAKNLKTGRQNWLVLGSALVRSGLLHCSHLGSQCKGRQECWESALLPATLPTCSVPSLPSHHPSAGCSHHCVTAAPSTWTAMDSLSRWPPSVCPARSATAATQQRWEWHSHCICAGRATDRQQLRIIDCASLRVTFYLNHKKMHRGCCELLWQGDLNCQLWLCANFLLSWHNCWLAKDQTWTAEAQLFANVTSYCSKTFAFARLLVIQSM